MATPTPLAPPVPQGRWQEIRCYANVNRAYDDVWPLLGASPTQVLAPAQQAGGAELHVHRVGITVGRNVRFRVGGVVVTEDKAKLAVRWEDARHPKLFPTLRAVIELVPLDEAHRQVTQVGLVGEYLQPFGPLGWVGNRLAGEGLAVESVGGFVEALARHFAVLIPPPPVPAPDANPRQKLTFNPAKSPRRSFVSRLRARRRRR